mmetsp:Transcript_5950/g.8820  ORF Transcript_5950/g.8820 Transcript_5950/m.8820 type:complete len:260 (+) Transcript_5950:371-1150(+)
MYSMNFITMFFRYSKFTFSLDWAFSSSEILSLSAVICWSSEEVFSRSLSLPLSLSRLCSFSSRSCWAFLRCSLNSCLIESMCCFISKSSVSCLLFWSRISSIYLWVSASFSSWFSLVLSSVSKWLMRFCASTSCFWSLVTSSEWSGGLCSRAARRLLVLAFEISSCLALNLAFSTLKLSSCFSKYSFSARNSAIWDLNSWHCSSKAWNSFSSDSFALSSSLTLLSSEVTFWVCSLAFSVMFRMSLFCSSCLEAHNDSSL